MEYDDMYDDDAGVTRRDEEFGYIVGWNGEQYQILRCGAVVEACEDCWGDVGEKYTGFWRDPLEELGTDFYTAIDVATEIADLSGLSTLVVNPDGHRVFFEGGTCAVQVVAASDPDELQKMVHALGLTQSVEEPTSKSRGFAKMPFSGHKVHRYAMSDGRLVWALIDHETVDEYVKTSGLSRWSYLVNHPFLTAAIRLVYPIFIPPAFVQEESDRYNSYSGRVDNETRELSISVLMVDIFALQVAFGVISRGTALTLIIGTLAHEMAHLAEGQSGLTYDGKWTFMGGTIMANVPSGSEVDAETVRQIVERDLHYNDPERALEEVANAVHFDSAITALLDHPEIRKAYDALKTSKDLRWGTHYDIDGLTGYVAIEVLPTREGVDVQDAVEQIGLHYLYVNPMFGYKFDAIAFYDVEMIREDYLNNSAPEDAD